MVIIRAIFNSWYQVYYISFEVELYLPPQARWSVSPLDERESADCQRNHKHDEKVKPAKNGEKTQTLGKICVFYVLFEFLSLSWENGSEEYVEGDAAHPQQWYPVYFNTQRHTEYTRSFCVCFILYRKIGPSILGKCRGFRWTSPHLQLSWQCGSHPVWGIYCL